VPDKQMHQLAY